MEQTQQNAKSNTDLDQRDSQRDLGRSTKAEISRSVDLKQVSYSEAAEGKLTKQQQEKVQQKDEIVTNQQFLESKLANCKTFVSSIGYLKDTSLLKAFLSFTSRQVIEWVIWMKQEGKSIDTGVSELFAMHNLSVEKLKVEEFDKIKLYFVCFQTLATKQY